MPLLGCATVPRPSFNAGRVDLAAPPARVVEALEAEAKAHPEDAWWVVALEKHLEVQDARAAK